MRRHGWALLALAAVILMSTGLYLGQWTRVKRHAEALCTACIGLTSGHH